MLLLNLIACQTNITDPSSFPIKVEDGGLQLITGTAYNGDFRFWSIEEPQTWTGLWPDSQELPTFVTGNELRFSPNLDYWRYDDIVWSQTKDAQLTEYINEEGEIHQQLELAVSFYLDQWNCSSNEFNYVFNTEGPEVPVWGCFGESLDESNNNQLTLAAYQEHESDFFDGFFCDLGLPENFQSSCLTIFLDLSEAP